MIAVVMRSIDAGARDLRHAFRLIGRYRRFSALAILSVALAAGTATVVYSVADALLFTRLPVDHPDELVSSHGGSYVLLRKIQRLDDVLAGAAGISLLDRFNVTAGEIVDPGPVRVALVTGNYFSLLGVRSAAGRPLAPDDDRTPGAHPVAVVSDRYWRSHVGAGRQAIGRTLMLNAVTYTIVGVLPATFRGDTLARPVDVWLPTMMQSEVMNEMPGLLTRTNGWLRIVARRRPDVTLARAQAAMQAVYTRDQLEAAGPDASRQTIESIQRDRFEVVPIGHGYTRDHDAIVVSLEILGAVAALLLVIACANLANLLLARGEARQREMAIRAAVGASRSRLFCQQITESAVLALLGGAIGVVFAVWATDFLSTTVSFGPTQLDPRAPSAWLSFDVGLGLRAVAFSSILCLVVGVLVGVAAAARGVRASLSSTMAGAALDARSARVGDALIVVQVALSLVLVVDATLFVRTLQGTRSVDLGVDRDHLLLAWTNPGQSTPVAELVQRTRVVRERLSQLPGVVSASVSNHGLLEGNEGGSSSDLIQVDGQPAARGLQVYRDAVAPGFFATVGAPIVSGRDFTDRDGAEAPHVVVLNRALARLLFGDRDPVGRRIGLPTDRAPIEVVGVVGDVRHGTPRDARGVWYVPAAQYPGLMRSMCIVVRTAGPPRALAAAVRRELTAIDAKLPVLHVDTLAEQLDDLLVYERIVAGVSSVFGVLALCIATVGLYAIVWYAFARRTTEIGIRIALGATRKSLVQEAVTSILARVALGIGVGIPVAIAVARLARSRLFGVAPVDPASVGAAALLMSTICALAAALPAHRASGINPIAALRDRT
jgi:predicted permease